MNSCARCDFVGVALAKPAKGLSRSDQHLFTAFLNLGGFSYVAEASQASAAPESTTSFWNHTAPADNAHVMISPTRGPDKHAGGIGRRYQ